MSAPAVRLPLVPSPLLALAIVVLHSAAAACVLAVMPGLAGAALATALFVLGLAAAWSRALLRSRLSVRALEIAGPALAVELTSGDRFAVEAGPRRYVSRFCVTLPLSRPVRRTILVSAGMMDPADFRLLRVWALWGRLPGVAAEQLPA